ncbi:ribonuclease J [Rickettsiales bacterium]|nr:ribonuclease J [Rickettsiales bacterium]
MSFDIKKHKNNLFFIPLGGSGEIGMNVNLYHLDGKFIMIDLGLGFANNIPGVNMIAPDLTFIKKHKKDLLAIVITHIHEDHIGAVQHLWQELKVPIYATNLAKNFLQAKLEEYSFKKKVKINVIEPERTLKLGSFELDFIGLTHSVPEMNAINIKTRFGNILHTGDWKFDPDPVVGNVSEKEKIAKISKEEGILAIVSDSTNILSAGRSGSEGELLENLEKAIQESKGMVGVTTFASNIARMSIIAKAAINTGRKVVLAGFSIRRLAEVGKKSGYLQDLHQCLISENEIKNYDRSEILVLCTGCQGEINASTMKIATDNHRVIKFKSGDRMIFSSKIIPGNEKQIFDIFNLLAKRKIEVITEKNAKIHVSGHPNRDEVEEMYQIAKPKFSIPVHGEYYHILEHRRLATTKWGCKKATLTENGCVIEINKDSCKKIANVETGYLAVDGKNLIPMEGKVIFQRKQLQEAGAIFASILLSVKGDILDVNVKSVGSYDFDNDPYCLNDIEDNIEQAVRNSSAEIRKVKKSLFKKRESIDKISKSVAKSIKSKLFKNMMELTGKKPVIEVSVMFNK